MGTDSSKYDQEYTQNLIEQHRAHFNLVCSLVDFKQSLIRKHWRDFEKSSRELKACYKRYPKNFSEKQKQEMKIMNLIDD